MSPPTVSVIIATLNEERFIEKAIKSILNQTYQDFEIVIVDGGSSDETLDIIKSFEDNRIELILEDNLGFAASLNRAIEESKGRYLARVDPDDLSRPSRLKKQTQFLKQNPDIAVVSCAYTVDDQIRGEIYTRYLPTDDDTIRKEMTKGIPIVHSGVMISREAIEESGTYREDIDDIEDLELWSRVGQVGKFANLNEVLLDRKIRSESSWHSKYSSLQRNITVSKYSIITIQRFGLARWRFIYCALRILYTFLPTTGKRLARRVFSSFDESDMNDRDKKSLQFDQ